jgi:2-polyprenyl-3-methyl-5-hydroxy-6-metoxy-1,4-benzoquinol methylase
MKNDHPLPGREAGTMLKLARRAWWRFVRIFSAKERLEALVGPPGAWAVSSEFPLKFLTHVGLEPHHKLLEIGCGVLRGGIPLIRYLNANCYTGYDIRTQSIELAHEQLAKNRVADKNPSLFVSSEFGRDVLEDRRFDRVLAFQVLYHLEDHLARECIAATAEFIERGGIFFANVNVVGHPAKWMEFPYVQRPLEFYESLASQSGLEMKVLGQLGEYGYSRKLGGYTNHMLAFTKN